MDADLCFLYSRKNRDFDTVFDIIKEKKFVSWWEIEAELAYQEIKPNIGPGLGLVGSQNYVHINNEPFRGALIDLIPVSAQPIKQYLGSIFENPVIAKFTELREVVWREFGNEYWLNVEINYGASGIVAKLTALDQRMDMIRF